MADNEKSGKSVKIEKVDKIDKTEKKELKSGGKQRKPTGFQKFLNAITGIPLKIKKSVLSTWHELKKVTWPTRKELINYSVVVLVFIALLGLIVGLLDMGASGFVRLIVGI